MGPMIDAWFVLAVSMAGWMNREQDKAMQYLLAENRVLKKQLKAREGRLRFTDKQRRLLAAKAEGNVVCSRRLGGLLKVCRREAA